MVGAARDRDRGFRLGPHAAHVEPAVADRDIVAAQDSRSFHAARGALDHLVLRQGEDDRRSAGNEIDEGRRRLAVGLGEDLVGEIARRAAAAVGARGRGGEAATASGAARTPRRELRFSMSFANVLAYPLRPAIGSIPIFVSIFDRHSCAALTRFTSAPPYADVSQRRVAAWPLVTPAVWMSTKRY